MTTPVHAKIVPVPEPERPDLYIPLYYYPQSQGPVKWDCFGPELSEIRAADCAAVFNKPPHRSPNDEP